MKIEIQADNKKFLEQAIKFYRNIDKHSYLLEAEPEELEAFKNDMKIFLFVTDKRYRSFTESFVRYNITVLRNRLEYLFAVCADNKRCTNKIGEELGIITPQYRVSWPAGVGHNHSLLDWGLNPGF
jgi:hypothetical protein